VNSGELTKKQIVLMEERTSFFINLAGIHIQKTLHLEDSGVPTRKLYKVLANALSDWHWLSYQYPKRFQFAGAGWLTWVPHRFGALGFVASNMQYGPQIHLNCGLFPNMIDLFNSGIYAKYGFRGVRKEGDERRLLFAPFIRYDMLKKSGSGQHEQHFWPQLIEIYAKLDDKTLDALASCRTGTTTTHSLWIQLVSWKRHMGRVLDTLQQSGSSLTPQQRQTVGANFEEARTCVKQFFVKIGYWNDIDRFVSKAREEAAKTELNDLVPSLNEIRNLSSLIGSKNAVLENQFKFVESLHGLCGEIRKLIDDPATYQPDTDTLERTLDNLRPILALDELLQLRRWLLLLMQQNVHDLARLCNDLVNAVFNVFEEELSLPILRLTPHYKAFLASYYPLPKDHFTKGN
jgi:hypothetical protein